MQEDGHCYSEGFFFEDIEKGGSKMALLAAPSKVAFCIDKRDSSVLSKKSTAVLDALRKIRAVESGRNDVERLQDLDRKIKRLEQAEG